MENKDETTLVPFNPDTAIAPLRPDDVLKQVRLIQEIMQSVMKDGEHYGKIPGCGDKPALLQPGAQKLILTFKMNPDYEGERDFIVLPNGHRDYIIKCILTNNAGAFIGAGLGSCSTLETKYRYRKAERICPKCGESAIIKGKAEYGGGWLCFTKKGGCGEKFDDNDPVIVDQEVGRVEHDNPADYYNTCLKMAKKRALVDATLTRTAASDIFTQDIEDMSAPPARSRPDEGTTAAPPTSAKPQEPPAPAEPGQLIASTNHTGEWPPKNAKGYPIRVVQPDSGKFAWAGNHPSEAQRGKVFSDIRAKGYESEEDQKALLVALYKDYGVERDDRWTFSKFNVGHASWFIDALLYVPIKRKDAPPPWKVGKKPAPAKAPEQSVSPPEPAPDPKLIPDPELTPDPQWENPPDPNEKEFNEPEEPGYTEHPGKPEYHEEAANAEEIPRTSTETETGGSDTADPTDEVDEDFLQ